MVLQAPQQEGMGSLKTCKEQVCSPPRRSLGQGAQTPGSRGDGPAALLHAGWAAKSPRHLL